MLTLRHSSGERILFQLRTSPHPTRKQQPVSSFSNSLLRRLSILLPAALITATAGVALTAAPADAVTCSKVGTGLKVNQTMNRGQCITSTNGRFTLVLQSDGNLVSYRNSDSRACFSSGTSGRKDAVVRVKALTPTAEVPLELNITRQSDAQSTYISFGGVRAGHPVSTLNVSVSGNNGSLFVGYSEYFGLGSRGNRIC